MGNMAVLDDVRYAEVFRRSPMACLLTDPAGRIREANDAAAALLGAASPEDLRGVPLERFIPMEQRRVFEGKLGIANGSPLRWRGGLRRRSGDALVQFTVTSLADVAALVWLLDCVS